MQVLLCGLTSAGILRMSLHALTYNFTTLDLLLFLFYIFKNKSQGNQHSIQEAKSVRDEALFQSM